MIVHHVSEALTLETREDMFHVVSYIFYVIFQVDDVSCNINA